MEIQASQRGRTLIEGAKPFARKPGWLARLFAPGIEKMLQRIDAALVTETEYKKLLAVNPAITQGLITLTYTRDIPFPRYYATEWATPEMREEARRLLAGLGTTTSGRTILALFGYDGIRLILDNGGPALETSRPAAPR